MRVWGLFVAFSGVFWEFFFVLLHDVFKSFHHVRYDVGGLDLQTFQVRTRVYELSYS